MKQRRRHWWPSVLVVLLATVQPLQLAARTHQDAHVERWAWDKFWSYAGCAGAIALSTGGAGLVAVGIACGRALTLYWTR